jgi:alkylhydroperoxidase family enzyme
VGVSDPIDELRAVVAATPAPQPVLGPYLAKVADCAYTVSDADVEELTAAGLSDDEIFEQTVAAAIAEGLRRLDAADAVIG